MNRILSTPIVAVLASFAVANGQEIGTEICSCSPRSFEFTLDFSLTCPPVNITLGDAVEATSCLISPFGDPNVDDLVPVSVEGIDILELGQNLRVVAQTDIDDVKVDGDTFVYTSFISDPNNVDSVVQVPRALQLNMVGINADGDRIINVFIVTFTNACGSYPVFQEGQSAGWARFTGLGPGSPELCSSAPQDSPIASPITLVPTTSPITLVPPSSFVAPSVPTPQASVVSPTAEAMPVQVLVPSGSADVPSESSPQPPVVSPTAEPTSTNTLVPPSLFVAPSTPSAQAPVAFRPTPPPIQILIPTDAPTVVIAAEIGSPTETEGSEEAKPEETDAPIKVPEPEETGAPISVPEPEETDAPIEVPEPEVSGAPIDVTEPERTDAPTNAAEPEETGAPIDVPEPEETGAPVDVPEPEETIAPVGVAQPDTNSPTSKPISATSAPVMAEDDDMDLPTDFFMDMSMSMSMPMKDPLLGDKGELNDLLSALSGSNFGVMFDKPGDADESPLNGRTQEFGAWKPFVRNVDTTHGVAITKRLRRGKFLKN